MPKTVEQDIDGDPGGVIVRKAPGDAFFDYGQFLPLRRTQPGGQGNRALPLREARAEARWGEMPKYQAYRNATPSLVPRPPRN